jgi:ATP-dependent Clp protease, protease subunit
MDATSTAATASNPANAAGVGASDPRYPGFPPEVPFPHRPGPARPLYPPGPGRPGPVVPFPMPGVPGPAGVFEDPRSRVYDDLLKRRTIVLDRALDGEAATLLAAQLITLDRDGAEPIMLVVNSPGGPLDAAIAVLDTIDLVRGPIGTTCLGRADGTAAVLVAAGTGRRRIGAGAHLRLRFADLELSGPARRLDDELAHHRELQATLVDRLAAVTGRDRTRVEHDVESARLLTAQEAVDYGLADEVIARGAL